MPGVVVRGLYITSNDYLVGGVTPEAAEAVCNATGDLGGNVLDGLQSLLAHNLLHREEQPAGHPRCVMLATIREYALERLTESREAEAIQRQHATYYLTLAEKLEPQVTRTEQDAWLQRLKVEQDNLHAADRNPGMSQPAGLLCDPASVDYRNSVSL